MGPMTPDCRSPVSVAVPGDAEAAMVTIKNAFLRLEPVWLEISPGAAPGVLLSAAVARGAPLVGSEDSFDMGDVVLVSTVDQDASRPVEKRKNSKSKGLLDSNGRRPGKKARELYQALVISLQDMVRRDPSVSLESLPLPKCVLDNDKLRARLVARVEAARPAVW